MLKEEGTTTHLIVYNTPIWTVFEKQDKANGLNAKKKRIGNTRSTLRFLLQFEERIWLSKCVAYRLVELKEVGGERTEDGTF